jgi:hypothetical protein
MKIKSVCLKNYNEPVSQAGGRGARLLFCVRTPFTGYKSATTNDPSILKMSPSKFL